MDLEKKFAELGGTFLTPADQISTSLTKIKAFIFDWDGVFNDGRKSINSDSNFSEIDSMGLNILRFDYWLRHKHLPHVFIITGMNNLSAAEFARREHLDGIYMNIKHKRDAFESICKSLKISASETAFVFDDILDIDVAKMSLLSFMVGRRSNPLLMDYVEQNKICSYISGFSGEDHAVREICELIIGLSGDYNRALELRIRFKGEYEEYLTERNSFNTKVVA